MRSRADFLFPWSSTSGVYKIDRSGKLVATRYPAISGRKRGFGYLASTKMSLDVTQVISHATMRSLVLDRPRQRISREFFSTVSRVYVLICRYRDSDTIDGEIYAVKIARSSSSLL